jgi:hypothetical protein
MDCTDSVTLNASKFVKTTYHSSEDSESVKVGVGLRFRFRALVSSTDATASLSARRLLLPLYEDEATGGGDAEALNCPFVRREVS